MYQIQTDPNISRTSIPSEPPPFSPPISAIWVNALLCLSLLISLTCALLATLLQHSARRYVGFTQQPEHSHRRRARVRAFFSEGVNESHISWVAEALPALVHISIYLFISGLLVWLFNINHLVFHAVSLFSALFVVAYLWFTLTPIFRLNNPCYTPISPIIWSIYHGISYTVLNLLSSMFGAGHHFGGLKRDYRERLSEGIGKTAERTALSSEIDVRILVSTLDALGDDSARVKYFEAIQSFFDSNQVGLHSHFMEFRIKFRPVLDGFLERTFSSGLISEPARTTQLLITCLNAAYKALGTDGVSQILFHILNGGSQWGELLQSVEMAHSLRRWSKNTDDEITHYVRRIVTQVIAGVRERDDRWISLAKAEFGVPDPMLRDNIRHGDSALLSLLIHMTRQAFRSGSWTPFVLNTLAQFDMCNTLPELQHEFCSLWNEIVREARRSGADCTAVKILREVRHGYIGLHQGTDAFSAHTNFYNPALAQPRSYPFCNIPSHRPDPIPTPQDPFSNQLIIPTPTRATFSAAASTTQVGDSSPCSTSLEIQGLSPNADIFIISNAKVVHTATRQAEEGNNIPRYPSPALTTMEFDHNPHASRSVRSTLPVTNEIFSMVNVCEGVRDLNPSFPVGPTQHPSKSALSIDDADANSVYLYSEDPTHDSCPSDTGESSQASAVVSLPSPYPGPDPTVVTTAPGPLLPPLSIPDLNHALNASQRPALAIMLPGPQENNLEDDIAAPWAESGIRETLTTANPMPRPNLSGDATLPKSKEVTVVPTAIFSDLQY